MIFGLSSRDLLFTSVSLFALTVSANAQSKSINIPAEELNLALSDYIQQSGVQLVYTVQDVGGLRSHEVKGQTAPTAALDVLLQGTPLVATRDVSGAVIVSRPLQRTAVASPPEGAGNTRTETVVVTSSRVIADAANSPTPLTIVTTAQLQTAAPTSLADALQKLPVFLGSFSSRAQGNASGDFAADTLSLRGFGPERTLVLFDGHRAAPTNADNSVNIDVLPQVLMRRVDVVTGGASAVYGSDAVTGVVNFVLDKNFVGFKFDANAGISNYSDGATYNISIGAGSDLFGGRGHIEGSLRAHHDDYINEANRPLGGQAVIETGLGTKANPYAITINGTLPAITDGGKITCTGCAANGQQFIANGIIGPFNPGMVTGTTGINSGGDGSPSARNTALSTLTASEESFLRFSYNINDDINFYVQGTVAQSFNNGPYLANYITTGATASTFFANNPYLPAAAQAQLASPSGTFTNNIYYNDQGVWGQQTTKALQNADSVTAGLDGAWGAYNWSLYFTHGEVRTKEYRWHNQNEQRMWASNDAVVGPGGTVQCYVSTTTYASLYPGCVPANSFGPTAFTSAMYNYIVTNTYYISNNTLDNVGGSIAGEIFNDWAGPVKAALSAEARWMSLGSVSTSNPAYVDCIGLRLCNTLTPLFGGTSVQSMPTASENVWEVAGEVNVPLLKSVPLIQELNVDLAGRYTDYSVSGSVETWKIGLDYHVNDEVRFRATNSIDIRAPNLYELYQPISISHASINDLHTNSFLGLAYGSSGNPNLTPEISRTYTGGIVFTPEFIPGLTASIDYYHINMTNVLTAVDGRTLNVMQLCESSGGTSALCSLYQRPLPFSNTTTFNQPTEVLASNLNAAYQRAEGWDIELDYGFPLGDVWADAPGLVNLRMMANIQPVLESVPFPGSPVNFTAVREIYSNTAFEPASKGHVTSFLTYNIGSWTFNLLDRWIAGFPKQPYYGLYYTNPRINSVNYQDITVDKKFSIDDLTFDGYFTVQNIGNVMPPLNIANVTNTPGTAYLGISPSGLDYDTVGRYFTLGVKARF